jgi:hypothetical protein
VTRWPDSLTLVRHGIGRLGYLARELLDELPQVLTQLER